MPLIDSVRFEELPEAVRTTRALPEKRLWLLPLYLGKFENNRPDSPGHALVANRG
ncbi:MAG: hypothetical protein R2857_05110 [Vampirovibrionales bacterium]